VTEPANARGTARPRSQVDGLSIPNPVIVISVRGGAA
jgi:hypothetical protein